jgi:CRP/FNR family cyclic AMP-dependent transcriptional regulator
MKLLNHLQPLLEKGVIRTYNAGSTILYQGEAPRSACIIKRGVVKAFNISASGEEQIVAFYIDGELFSTPWIFGKAPSTIYFYEAVTDCEIYFVPREELRKFSSERSHVLEALLDYYVTISTAALIRISALEQPKAREKIMYTLYFLCQRYGEAGKSHTKLRLQLTHQQLANLVGLTRETTATELNKLKRQKILEYANQTYSVNENKLIGLLGEDSFKNVKLQ